jgi:hypothetical protein
MVYDIVIPWSYSPALGITTYLNGFPRELAARRC